MSDYKIEQCCTIKFCLKLGMNATETCGKLQEAYGDDALSQAQIFRWFKDFSSGRDLVEDEPRPGKPSFDSFALWTVQESPTKNLFLQGKR